MAEEEKPIRDYGLGEDGQGWVKTEVRERDEDAREFLLKIVVVVGAVLALVAGVVWAALSVPHVSGLN